MDTLNVDKAEETLRNARGFGDDAVRFAAQGKEGSARLAASAAAHLASEAIWVLGTISAKRIIDEWDEDDMLASECGDDLAGDPDPVDVPIDNSEAYLITCSCNRQGYVLRKPGEIMFTAVDPSIWVWMNGWHCNEQGHTQINAEKV